MTGRRMGDQHLEGDADQPALCRATGLPRDRGRTREVGAIISEDDHRRVLAKYAEKKMSNRRTPQRYLLSGMLRCGKCGTVLYSSARTTNGKTTRRYVCLSGPDHGGCGRLTVTADPLERFVCDAVLYRLDTPDLADVLAGRSSADERTQELTHALDEANEQLEELSLAYANRDITMREWMVAKKPITGQARGSPTPTRPGHPHHRLVRPGRQRRSN